ncbi:hypothetical protein DKT69_28550 [Micromonospora sicca]|uniref:Uncharacterized protein n=1 Tax=Micromonospora sicca TaxID=2202420 RepID=A0A317D6Y4_9ACTN|nr:hypothetical protein [Micromonospora sp. 4G51]PWR10598.1 hypothetical protein DKT69_28550 [Micromonospora sp. 4G51]
MAQSRWRLVFLAVIALAPLLVLVLRRLRRVDLVPLFGRAMKDIGDDKERAIEVGVRMLNGRILRSREHWAEPALLRKLLARSYQRQVLEPMATDLRLIASGVLRRQSIGRFLTLLAGTTASTYLLNYSLVILAMPRPLAEKWSGVRPSTAVLSFPFDLQVTLPLWPYTGVAGLFAIVAAVGFLAFSLTDETYTTALTEAVFIRPARLLLIVGVPYLHQHERRPRVGEAVEKVNIVDHGTPQLNRAVRRAMNRGDRKS